MQGKQRKTLEWVEDRDKNATNVGWLSSLPATMRPDSTRHPSNCQKWSNFPLENLTLSNHVLLTISPRLTEKKEEQCKSQYDSVKDGMSNAINFRAFEFETDRRTTLI